MSESVLSLRVTSGCYLFDLLQLLVAPMKKLTVQSLKLADGKLRERSCCWLVIESSSTSESTCLCLSDVCLLERTYKRTPSKLQCPVRSIICCSSTPDSYSLVVVVALGLWLVL